ncbi:tyrosine recombinase XerC [Tateyamaria omphalii]|nr:tyrosine recombinase XerC [Tateyamaria omphalii]
METAKKNDRYGMSSQPKIDDALREAIISRPDVILDDKDLMHALIAANERAMGGNIVDLRGLAMERLEARLDRLEDTHRSVIAAAYENLAGTNQIHRAILRMLDPMEFEPFLRDLGGEVAEILRVDAVKLVLESVQNDSDPAVQRLGEVLSVAEPGFIDDYLTDGRGGNVRQVTLRQVQDADPEIYGDDATWIRSEACLKLDFGDGRLPGLLVMGAEDPHMFGPQQGTDLLAFFTGVFERAMRRWLG